MKGILLASLLVFVLIFFSAPNDTYSAGATNDVVPTRQGDVLFLTTTATRSGQQTTSALSTTTKTIDSLHKADIFIPTGFATDIGILLNALLSAAMLIGVLLVFLQLILAGFYWITSGGDKGKIDSARQRLIAAIIGLIILASSFAILTLGLNFLGFKSLQEVLESTKALS